MLNKYTLFIFFFAINFQLGFAQNLEVQTWNYESETRDTMIEFPDVDHNQYEKILMYYSMRCKDGLVSPGVPGQTNIGCGEWDYSCNTSIIDSSRMDSLYSISPSHVISGFSGSSFDYTTQATYTYTQYDQFEANYTDLAIVNDATIGAGTDAIPPVLGNSKTSSRSQFLYKASDLIANGYTAGTLTGLRFNVDQVASNYQNVRISLRGADQAELSSIVNEGFQEVFFADVDFEEGENTLTFYQAFSWDGAEDIIVDLSYEHPTGTNVLVDATDKPFFSSLFIDGSRDYHLEVQGAAQIDVNHAFPEISNEITISFWSFGGIELPVNNSIIEGVDANNQRQINVHLPWSNGQIYWDCGNVGGYDRINKTATPDDYKGKWNHWAFTKNASTGSMKIFLNGEQWHSGTGKTKPIDLQSLVIGANAFDGNQYFGKIDEFQIWNKALEAADIQTWMHQSITSDHPYFENLIAYYPLDDAGGMTISDASPSGKNGVLSGSALFRQRSANELNQNVYPSIFSPNLAFIQANYSDIAVSTIPKLDSLVNLPNQVEFYSVDGTDLVLDDTQFLYASGLMPILDEMGNLIGTVDFPIEGTINISDLEHYTKQPTKIELMSFVTPYGINLDLGMEGKTWVFDVTDFGPVLKGKKRLLMDRGGQWQEDMDIRFIYLEGTPSRNVLDLQQVWRVTSEGYANINNDTRFQALMMPLSEDASMYKLRAAITGHGQEGEFIPRMHYLNVNGGDRELEWQVWKECADNPVYPQGGTWIYDRAGWCPGMATDVQELDITDLVTPGGMAELDYGMEVASGDSRYIVNIQMVSYGEPNFTQDAALVDIINPSTKVEHERYNPICGNPRILIRNNGSSPLTSLEITYAINENTETYTWSGNLNYLEEEEVTLPALSAVSMTTEDAQFRVSISNPNGGQDEYTNNNDLSTAFKVVDQRPNGVVIKIKTNLQANETSWKLLDINGNLIASRIGGMSPNTNYIDTVANLNGCYRLLIEDSDDDGISFWANNDGNGSVSMSNFTTLPINVFEPLATDFGKIIVYEFVAGDITSVEDLADDRLFEVYPNPSKGIYQLELGGFDEEVQIYIQNQLGQIIEQFRISNAFQLHQQSIDLQKYPNGIYYLELVEAGKRRSKKIVKVE